MTRIEVDRSRCVGAGQCVLSAPDVFDQDDDGMVRLLMTETDGAHEDEVHEASMVCPSQAVSLH